MMPKDLRRIPLLLSMKKSLKLKFCLIIWGLRMSNAVEASVEIPSSLVYSRTGPYYALRDAAFAPVNNNNGFYRHSFGCSLSPFFSHVPK